MTGKPKLLWVGQVPAPANVVQAARGWALAPYDSTKPLAPQVKSAVLTVVCPDGRAANLPWLASLSAYWSPIDRVAKSPFAAFCSTESEKCHFRFPHKSRTYVAGH